MYVFLEYVNIKGLAICL